MKQYIYIKIFRCVFLAISVILLGTFVQSCNSERDEMISQKKESEIEDLKYRFGVDIEYEDIEKVSLKELQVFLLKIKKEYEAPIQLEIIENDSILVFSSVNTKNIVRLKSETEAEASTSHNDINFKVILSENNDITYEVTSSVYNINRINEKSSKITSDSFEFKIEVVISMGGAYLHVPYKIEGTFGADSISCTVTQE